jgi:hypothetical protein
LPGGYTDQTGILHISEDHHPPTAADPVSSNLTSELHKWSQCLAKYGKAHPDEPLELEAAIGPHPKCTLTGYVKDNYLEVPIGYRVYRVDYFSDAADGTRPRAAFHALAGPTRYGDFGVRHYYMDETGIIRGTPENRDATRDDPPIPDCEWDRGKACAPK